MELFTAAVTEAVSSTPGTVRIHPNLLCNEPQSLLASSEVKTSMIYSVYTSTLHLPKSDADKAHRPQHVVVYGYHKTLM